MGQALHHERSLVILGIQVRIEFVEFAEFLLCGVEFVLERGRINCFMPYFHFEYMRILKIEYFNFM